MQFECILAILHMTALSSLTHLWFQIVSPGHPLAIENLCLVSEFNSICLPPPRWCSGFSHLTFHRVLAGSQFPVVFPPTVAHALCYLYLLFPSLHPRYYLLGTRTVTYSARAPLSHTGRAWVCAVHRYGGPRTCSLCLYAVDSYYYLRAVLFLYEFWMGQGESFVAVVTIIVVDIKHQCTPRSPTYALPCCGIDPS